ncbi:methionine--tRNA ligase [Methanococcoides sp. SA1]|nr:methionine--tRNA ligase [Methanococcoides sp. SA1]
MAEKFYITTPIYYPNDVPHIGHAYTTVMCDILARWNKLQGKEVLFSTGTDEHGKKIQETAEKAKVPPQEFVDQMAEKFKLAWKDLNIEYSRFIKTTDKDHQKNVQEVLQKVYDKGDIYLDKYEGYYCVGCEAYLTEKELVDGCCPIHKKKVELMKEKSYFFKIQKYKDKILKLFDSGFILPKNKTKEMKNRVKELDRDLSISRTSFDWGIPLPFDKSHVAYVWFDALLNYHTVAKETDEKFWPANLHVVAKDIFYFHTVIWPAILMSADLPLPKNVFVHGYWTIENEKMSKSLGNVVNIPELISIAGVDSARYFLAREISFGEDGDFSRQSLIDRHNNELANKLGNLISRTSALAEKYGIKTTTNSLLKKLDNKKIKKHFEEFRIDKALSEIFAFIDNCNEFIQNKKPWETKSKTDLFQLVESIREIATLLSPFIPETAEQIQDIFKTDNIKKAPILFQKIENQKIDKKEIPNKSMENVKNIQFEDFTKIDLRVAEISNVEDIEKADKLYKLTLNVGELGERTICAGIKEFYNHDDLKGKKIIIIANLEPRKLRGIESCGMLLAASSPDKKTVSLISPDTEIAPGSTVG